MIMNNNRAVYESQGLTERKKGERRSAMRVKNICLGILGQCGKQTQRPPIKTSLTLKLPELDFRLQSSRQIATVSSCTNRDLMSLSGGAIGNVHQHPFRTTDG